MGDNTQSLIDQSVIVAKEMIMHAEKHGDASSQYVEPRLLPLLHSEAPLPRREAPLPRREAPLPRSEAPLPETGFAAGFPARASGRRKEHGDRHSDRG